MPKTALTAPVARFEAARAARYEAALACAQRYGFSVRHWLRLVDAGKAPQPVRFGRLTRWSVQTLEEWESQGCPRVGRSK
jgi:predicted DNA-binding transcriptional regulator AlpA